MDVNSDQADLALLLQQSDTFPHYANYQPLDKATRSIRLLQIRRKSDGEIHAAIVHASLDDSQIEYEALSYCWGPPDIPKTIYIGHEALPIRTSLHNFLDALCRKNQSLPIWVDSVCINQRDVQERNWQVSMMGDIYRHARRVKSWIGLADAHSDFALAYANHCHDEEFLLSSNFDRARRMALESFQTLLDRPYWKRMWVVQEMVLAEELLVMCGSRTVSWEGLLSAYLNNVPSKHIIYVLSDLKKPDWNKSVTPVDAAGPTSYDQFWGAHITESSLLAQMRRFGAQTCEDPRDRIFGLLSISEHADQIAVDYTKSLADVLLGAILVAYHVFLTFRRDTLLAAGDQHAISRQDPDHLETLDGLSLFEMFNMDILPYLRAARLLVKPVNLLYSLSSMEDCLGICARIQMLESRAASSFSSPDSDEIVFDKEDEETLAEKLCIVLGDSTLGNVIVHWRSHEVVPRIIGHLGSRGGSIGFTEVYLSLLQMGEIQLCSQAWPFSILPWLEHKGDTCEFSVHLSPFAVLAIVCLGNLRGLDTDPLKVIQALDACLRNRRGKYSRPELCACEVSAELNLEAFRFYKGKCDRDESAWRKYHDRSESTL